MRQRRRVMCIVARHHQTADVVRCRFDGELATADDVCVTLLADPSLQELKLMTILMQAYRQGVCWYMGTRYWRSITSLGIGFSPV